MSAGSATRSDTPDRAGMITTLGVPSVEWKGRKWALPTKAIALIAWLSTQPGGLALRSQARDFLWGEFDSDKANANLRQTLARVRKLEQRMGAALLLADPHTIALNSQEFRVDLGEALAINVRELIENRSLIQLESFVGTITGEPLGGIEVSAPDFEAWRAEVQDQLQRDAVIALGALIETSANNLAGGKREELARKLLEIDPTAELGYRVLMEFHAARNERALALQIYRQCRKVLRDELGIEPEPATRRLAVALGFVEVALVKGKPVAAPGEQIPTTVRREGTAHEIESGVPRIILFPPSVVTDDGTVARVATALVEDVISGLSRCRSFIVVAPHTSLQIGGAGTITDAVSDRLSIRYAVNTTVKPILSGLGVVFRLTSCKSGIVVWSSEVKFDLDQLPFLFSQLSHQVIYSLADAIEQAELKFPFAAKNATAYRLYLEGRAAMTGSDLPNLRSARNWYRKSIDQYESFGPAFAGLARTLSMERLVRGLTDDAMLKQALVLADRAAELDPFDGRGMRERGFSCLYLKRHDESLYSFQRAAELNPSDADLFADYADALAHSGRPKEGLEKCLRAIALNPLGPDYYHWILGSIYFQTEDYGTALKALEPVKHHPETARLMAASSALAGNTAEARHYAAIVRENYPEFRLEHLPQIVPDRFARDTQHLIEGLRLAGVE